MRKTRTSEIHTVKVCVSAFYIYRLFTYFWRSQLGPPKHVGWTVKNTYCQKNVICFLHISAIYILLTLSIGSSKTRGLNCQKYILSKVCVSAFYIFLSVVCGSSLAYTVKNLWCGGGGEFPQTSCEYAGLREARALLGLGRPPQSQLGAAEDAWDPEWPSLRKLSPPPPLTYMSSTNTYNIVHGYI